MLYFVQLNTIIWDLAIDADAVPEVNLPSDIEIKVEANNEDDAIDTAIDKVSDETGWRMKEIGSSACSLVQD